MRDVAVLVAPTLVEFYFQRLAVVVVSCGYDIIRPISPTGLAPSVTHPKAVAL